MELIIDENLALREIQKAFTTAFPYLKIEFYETNHDLNEASSKKKLLDSNLTIKNIKSIKSFGTLSISQGEKVADVERNFFEIYGLNAQIFRKSSNVWLQTTATDNWTLSHQNEIAKESLKVEENEIPDFELSDNE